MLFHQPTDDDVRRFLAAQRRLRFSYPEVGASRNPSPPGGYLINRYRDRLGAGFWSLNASRIVYTVDESRRYGFALGTLPGRTEAGEERFALEWERESGAVWYELFSFVRPKPLLARIGYPLVRAVLRRFAAEPFGAIRKATTGFPSI